MLAITENDVDKPEGVGGVNGFGEIGDGESGVLFRELLLRGLLPKLHNWRTEIRIKFR